MQHTMAMATGTPQNKRFIMSRTIAVHVRYNSWYISLLSSAKQQREMTQHRTKRPQHRPKRTFEGQKGQNEAIQDKRTEGAPF